MLLLSCMHTPLGARHAHPFLEIAVLLFLHALRPPAIGPAARPSLECIVFNQKSAIEETASQCPFFATQTQHTTPEPALNPIHDSEAKVRPTQRRGDLLAHVTRMQNWERSTPRLLPGYPFS